MLPSPAILHEYVHTFQEMDVNMHACDILLDIIYVYINICVKTLCTERLSLSVELQDSDIVH